MFDKDKKERDEIGLDIERFYDKLNDKVKRRLRRHKKGFIREKDEFFVK